MAIVICLIINFRSSGKQLVEIFKNYLFMFLGFASLGLVFALYFYFNSSLASFFNIYFIFNLAHANATLGATVALPQNPINLILYRFWLLFSHVIGSKILLLYSLFWLLSIYLYFLKKKFALEKKVLVAFTLILFPIEIFLANFSIYVPFDHYNITLLPSLALLSAVVYEHGEGLYIKSLFKLKKVFLSVGLTLVLTSLLLAGISLVKRVANAQGEQSALADTVQYIKENTTATDTIFVWGAKATLYFLSDRKSPSKYFFSSPIFYIPHDDGDAIFLTFVDDINRERQNLSLTPKWIIQKTDYICRTVICFLTRKMFTLVNIKLI